MTAGVRSPASPSAEDAGLRVDEVVRRKDHHAFVELRYRLLGDDPNWVAPLRLTERRRWSEAHNPSLRTRWTCRFIARRQGVVVGRIAAIEDRGFTGRWAPRTGFFGFFDCVRDQQVASRLLRAAETALRARGVLHLVGPIDLTTHDEVGLLLDGFDRPPALLDPYNPPWYRDLLEGAGYRAAHGYDAYEWRPSLEPRPVVKRALSRLAAQAGTIAVRPVRIAEWEAEVERLHRLYNDCFDDLWGFTRIGLDEMRARADGFRPFLEPELALIAEDGDQPVGFALVLPDVNVALAPLRGRLLPFGWLHLLRGLRQIRRARMLLLGVLPTYRGRGVAALLAARMAEAGRRLGITECELSLVQDDNGAMRAVIEAFDCPRIKSFSLFERELEP